MPQSNKTPSPQGTLSLQTLAMPKDTNPEGVIFGGWVLSQMDLAAAIYANRLAKAKVATVAISNMTFLKRVDVGATVSCYTDHIHIGNTSMRIQVEVWCETVQSEQPFKVTEGEFVFVALDENNKPTPISLKK